MSVQDLKNSKELVDGDQYRKSEDELELQKMLPEELDQLFDIIPLSKDTTCGFWFLRGKFIQKFASKKVYVCLYGLIGCLLSAAGAYFNATITTLEKRFKIPSRNTGIISIGGDISSMLISTVLSYYAGKGHRPRWMAFGLMSVALNCILKLLIHVIYGPGLDALSLTLEYGATLDGNATLEVMEQEKLKTLCTANNITGSAVCDFNEGSFAPQVLFFMADFISGMGAPLYHSIGLAYMDDNVQKAQSPFLFGLSFFIRMLGPAVGSSMASLCLKYYISPSLTPTITNTDPRWLGAWWMGWIVFGIFTCIFSVLFGMLPKILHRAAVRKIIQNEKIRRGISRDTPEVDSPTNLRDLLQTMKRLSTNKVFMWNNFSTVFYFFGDIPYYLFTPKYIETQYRQSASVASLVSGTIALVFTAIGILMSGVLVSKFKPRARYLAGWNVVVGILSVVGMIFYVFLGCDANDNSLVLNIPDANNPTPTCNSNCHCDYVKYSPICGSDGRTYISPCHAGCEIMDSEDGQKFYEDCSCIFQAEPSMLRLDGGNTSHNNMTFGLSSLLREGGTAKSGNCEVDCMPQFISFLVVMCALKLLGASGISSNVLISVRCVEEKDKTVSMGYSMTLLSLLAFIPSPIFFGALFDKTCVVWGKTCTGTGNCWSYDGETMRYMLNFIASLFCFIGILCDVGVWYYAKNLQFFDQDDLEMVEQNNVNNPQKQNELKCETINNE